MRQAEVYVDQQFAGLLSEQSKSHYIFEYDPRYQGHPVSLTMPVAEKKFEYSRFPPFFDGVLPEGFMLNALLKYGKLDATDYFGQLIRVGEDLVGNVTVREHKP